MSLVFNCKLVITDSGGIWDGKSASRIVEILKARTKVKKQLKIF